MNNRQISIKKGLSAVPLAFILLFWTVYASAQTFVTAPMTGTPAAGEYWNNTGITLNPGFSFTATAGSSLYIYVTANCMPLATVPSANMNYIMTSTARAAGYNPAATGNSTCDVMQTVQYFDGLGRLVQTVQVKGSPAGNDLVQPMAYDAFGREAVKYLPYADLTGADDGSYNTTAVAAQALFYHPAGSTGTQQSTGVVNTSYPIATTVFEASPLNRVVEQGAPGASWQPGGHTLKISYGTNGTNEVLLWTVNSTGAAGASGGVYYIAGMLYATTTTDENGYNSIEYKDKEGKIVCKKAPAPTAGTYLTTYYVYDDLNNLRYVIPPPQTGTAYPASFTEATTDALFWNFVYGYHYDERNRLIQKKIPGKGWEYMVYNKLDQLVLSQDAVQRAGNQWLVTKYDAQGRVIMTDLWNAGSAIAQSTLQASIYAGAQWDVRDYTDNVDGYTITSYPATVSKVLTINYYDNYTNIPRLPPAFIVSGYSTMTKGLLTATKTAVLAPSTDTLSSVHYYDDLGRNVKTFQQHYLGGTASPYNYDAITTQYNFTNADSVTTRQHYTKNTAGTAAVLALTINNTYTYDQVGRKTQTLEKINAGSNILLSQEDYNEVGQVKAKHLHGATGAAPFLQDIIYKYNERGWLKRINDPAMALTTTRLFSEQLNYDSVAYAAVPKYNGNIAEQDYNAGVSTRQHVVYTYDPLNRLTAGTSSAGLSENPITYDNLGNITSLKRGANAAYIYTYAGNQLTAVGGVTGSNYTYDVNGNVHHDGRNNADVTLNMLNLPAAVTSTAPATAVNITYTYDATGQKLRKISTANGVTTTTDYISGIQYRNGALDFFQTEEGRVIYSAGAFNHEYTLTDHLGNNRVTFDQVTGKVGEDDYYPFGIDVPRDANTNLYLYNGKELQPELGTYDYGARQYDAVIARWTTPDPLAEISRRFSPYNYVQNNPISLVDPDGMKVDSASKPEWDRQKQLVTDKRNNFNQGIADLRALAGATGVNFDGLIGGLQQQVTSLDGTLSNLTNLENSTQVYGLRGGVTEVGGTTLNTQNHIITFAFGTTANFIHETTHGGQFEAGEIAFNSTGAIVGQDVNDEISAYQRQFAYDPSSVSGLRSSSVANTLSAINATWVQGITTSTGDRIYSQGGTANTGISPVNINSDRAALIRAYPNLANQLQSLPANFTLKSIPGLYYKH